jgi:sugar-specific transcriptional regulator TrmB
MYEELMKKLGFEDKEIMVFIAVLERGRVTPATVANVTGIKRPTVYSVASILANKGVLYIDTTSEPAYLVVESGDVLENLIKKQELQLEEDRKTVQETMKLLENVPKSMKYSVPKVKFYNEKELKDALYRQTPIWHENALLTGETIWWGFEDAAWIRLYPDCVKYHWDVAPQEVGARYIIDDRELEKTKREQVFDERRQVKFINPEQHSFTATQVVVGDYVLLIMSNEKPYYMIEIHDRVMAHNLREVFKMLWDSLGDKAQ